MLSWKYPVMTHDSREARFRVMGTDAHCIIVGGETDALDACEAHLRAIELRWSRFLPDSELMRMNSHPGVPVVVSPDTFSAVQLAVQAWEYTDGVFDPTTYDALIAAGYDRSFTEFDATTVITVDDAPAQPAPTPAAIVFDPVVRAITLPAGVHVDLGGIGKGLAADLVVRALLANGVSGACVNLGGDLCALGTPPDASGWIVELTLPTPDALGGATEIAIPHGAVATSSTQVRRWQRTDGDAHHLIDPRTGGPASSDIAVATVLALDAWWAETCAKAIIVTGALDVALRNGNAGLIVRTDNTVETFGDFDRYLISPDSHAPLNQ